MKSNKILDNLIKDVDADLHFLRRHKANIKAFAKEYHNEQLILKDVVKSLPQNYFCIVCNLPTDGEKCYSKRCLVYVLY